MRGVRNTILKMEGLQTRQILTSGAALGTTTGAGCVVFPIGDNGGLVNLAPIPVGTPQKAYLRSMENRIICSNGTNVQLHIRMYKLQCRKNTVYTLNQLLPDGAPAYTNSYIDPTTSVNMRRYFKIVKRMRKKLDVGDSFSFTARRFWRGGRQITGEIEVTSGYVYTPLSIIWLVCADTIPLEDGAVLTQVSNGTAKLNWVSTQKYTYYIDQTNSPTSTAQDNIQAISNPQVFTDVTAHMQTTDG